MSLVLSGLLCFVLGPVMLRALAKTSAMNRVVSLYSAELSELLLLLFALSVLWLFMGALWFIPVIGHLIGWPWVTSFVDRWDGSAPIPGMAGAGLHLTWLMVVTLAIYRFGSNFYAPALCNDTSRRALGIGAFYGACVSFDLVRLCFSLERFSQLGILFASVAFVVSFIGIAAFTDLKLRARGSRLPLFQMVSSLLAAMLVRRLLETGSIHTAHKSMRQYFGISVAL